MKRGLVVLDTDEIGVPEWAGRTRTLQNELVRQGIDVALIYADVFRSDDVGYLSNLCIYWNEGMLAVPADGRLTFLTKLSPRVHTWMRRTSMVDDLRSGKSFGDLVAKLIEGRDRGVIGLVDEQLWPETVLAEIHGVSEGWEVRPLGSIVRDRRAVPSPSELTLLRTAGTLLADALATATQNDQTPTARISIVERAIRRAGFTDAMVEATPAPDGSLSLEVTGEYRHGWLYASRVVGPETRWAATLRAALADGVAAARPGVTTTQLAQAVGATMARLPAGSSWTIRHVNQADLATHGEFLPSGAEQALSAGSVVAVSIETTFADSRMAVVADTVLIGEDSPENLTAPVAVTAPKREGE